MGYTESTKDKPVDQRFTAFIKGLSLWNHTSQFGEDSIIDAIFKRIGTTNKWCAECGASDGLFFSNTRKLIEDGWSAVQIEADPKFFESLKTRYADNPRVRCVNAFVGLKPGERLDDILEREGAPYDLDLLVIDVDGQDYHLWNSLVNHRPRVLLVEFNPQVDSMYIPEPGAEGTQAGIQPLRWMAKAKGYTVICSTHCNLICVPNEIASLLQEPPAMQAKDSPKDSEMTYIVDPQTGSSALWKIGVVGSIPRLGFQAHTSVVFNAFRSYNVTLLKMRGAYWEQGLQNGLNSLLESGCDVIITLDYDSIFSEADVKELLTLAVRYPEADALVPWQVKRGGLDAALFGLKNKDGVMDKWAPREAFTGAVTEVELGHFGLTLIRASALKAIPKPWLMSLPDPSTGDWNDAKTDADIYFWKKFREAGKRIFLANNVRTGHIEELILWADPDCKVVKQQIGDWYRHGRPW